jgi:hypothetical protein
MRYKCFYFIIYGSIVHHFWIFNIHSFTVQKHFSNVNVVLRIYFNLCGIALAKFYSDTLWRSIIFICFYWNDFLITIILPHQSKSINKIYTTWSLLYFYSLLRINKKWVIVKVQWVLHASKNILFILFSRNRIIIFLNWIATALQPDSMIHVQFFFLGFKLFDLKKYTIP